MTDPIPPRRTPAAALPNVATSGSDAGLLRGRVALVTGAAQGMGRAVVERFVAEGAVVVATDRNGDELRRLESRGATPDGAVRYRVLDVADPDQVAATVDGTLAELGRIDVLVNAAGILRPTPFHTLPVAEWDEVVAVNLRGTFLTMRAVYPSMRERSRGSIVNFASTAGLTVSTLGGAHYTASKHAVVGLTKAVAKEGGPHGVRVNAVCPGLIDTEMVRSTIDPDKRRDYEASFPIGRLGTPEEVAELVVFLASDRSSYLTGTAVNISGGDLL